MTQLVRLILVAGPSGSGKSTVMKHLSLGKLGALAVQLHLEDPASWTYINAKEFEALDPLTKRVVVHYDMLRPVKAGLAEGFDADRRLDVVEAAGQVTFITLWAPVDLLRRRHNARQRHLMFRFIRPTIRPTKWRRNVQLLRKYKQLDHLYAHPDDVLGQYDRWFEYCRQRKSEAHWILSVAA